MNRPGITAGSIVPCAIDKLGNSFTVRNLCAVFGQGCSNSNVINFLKPTAALALECTGACDSYNGGALTPCFHHCGYGVGKPFRTYQANSGLAGDTGVTIGQMAGYLLVRRIDHRHLARHNALQRRVAEAATQHKNLANPFFIQCSREQRPTTNFYRLFSG